MSAYKHTSGSLLRSVFPISLSIMAGMVQLVIWAEHFRMINKRVPGPKQP